MRQKSPLFTSQTIFFRLLIFALFLGFALGSAPLTTQAADTIVAEANDAPAMASFRNGVAAYQKGDFKAARISFEESLKHDAFNAAALFNLGLTEQRVGRLGLALGLWRRALALHPGFSPAARAIEWGRGQLERSEIPHEVELWESIRDPWLIRMHLETYVGLSALFLLASGWMLLRYLGLRRRALLDEQPLPSFPVVASLLSVVFVATSTLAIMKAIDANELRGTIIEKKVEARSTPDTAGTPLFDLYEGLEIILRQARGEWIQVSYPGGSTGWVPRSALIATTDKVVP